MLTGSLHFGFKTLCITLTKLTTYNLTTQVYIAYYIENKIILLLEVSI